MSVEIHGHCEPAFAGIKDAFASGFENGYETGASVAVTRGDEFVVDLWAGFADEAKTRPFLNDSLVWIASTTKIVTNLCALILVDQGKLDPERPMVDYWPEFGNHGKDKILVKHLFAHTAGVPGWKPPVPWKIMTEWGQASQVMEAQPLWYEPGTKVCYHAETFGFLAGELIRRISGLTPGKFLRQHIAPKIGADLWIGIPENELESVIKRISDIVGLDAPPSEDLGRAPEVFYCYEEPAWYPPEVFTSEFPGGNCFASANALAKIGAIHANHGEFQGHRFLSKTTLDFALEEQSYDLDLAADERIRRGFGLGINSIEFPCPSDQCLHWGGYGGSLLMMDLASKTSLAYVPNNWTVAAFHNDPRNIALLDVYTRLVK